MLSDKELPLASLPGKAFIQNLPEGDGLNKPGAPQLTKPTNLVTETLRTVNSNIGSIAQAKKFGGKMGIGTMQMLALSMGYGEWHTYLRSTIEGLGRHATEEFEMNGDLQPPGGFSPGASAAWRRFSKMGRRRFFGLNRSSNRSAQYIFSRLRMASGI